MYVNVNEVFTWCPETPTYPTLAREGTSGRSAGAAWKAPYEKFRYILRMMWTSGTAKPGLRRPVEFSKRADMGRLPFQQYQTMNDFHGKLMTWSKFSLLKEKWSNRLKWQLLWENINFIDLARYNRFFFNFSTPTYPIIEKIPCDIWTLRAKRNGSVMSGSVLNSLRISSVIRKKGTCRRKLHVVSKAPISKLVFSFQTFIVSSATDEHYGFLH